MLNLYDNKCTNYNIKGFTAHQFKYFDTSRCISFIHTSTYWIWYEIMKLKNKFQTKFYWSVEKNLFCFIFYRQTFKIGWVWNVCKSYSGGAIAWEVCDRTGGLYMALERSNFGQAKKYRANHDKTKHVQADLRNKIG